MATAYARPDEVTPERRPYQPYGAALELMRCRAKEIVLSGPAGTGKSRGCLEKLHLAAEKYKGMRGLILRKTRESLSESALFTFETKVVPQGHPALTSLQRNNRQHYHYSNGSEIVVGGMDKPAKVMSTEYDMIFVQEAIELAEAEWEALTTRLRNGRMPYQQLIADTNPDTPQHWLKQRANRGQTLMLESRHEDNPSVTPEYLATLDALTGPRKERLRFGRWVQAEGVVYEGWDRAIHVIEPFTIPMDWPRYWSVDFGYTNPFVCLVAAKDPDGRLFVYRERYRTQMLVEDHAAGMLARGQFDPRPRAVVCDHDAEDRATLERHLKLPTIPAQKAISAGIQAVASRLRKAGDGLPRLFVVRGCLEERDAKLDAAKKPTSIVEEFDGYVWDVGGGRRKGEVPSDKDNHAMDALRYLVMHVDGGAADWVTDGRREEGRVFVPGERSGKWVTGGGGVVSSAPRGVWG